MASHNYSRHTTMKEQILKLRSEGKSYSEIQSITGAAISTIRYHCSPHYRECSQKRKSKSRRTNLSMLKELGGSKCQICGYNRCMNALEFHHKDMSTKLESVSELLRLSSIDNAKEEIKKCILLCANCHREVHAGIAFIPSN